MAEVENNAGTATPETPKDTTATPPATPEKVEVPKKKEGPPNLPLKKEPDWKDLKPDGKVERLRKVIKMVRAEVRELQKREGIGAAPFDENWF